MIFITSTRITVRPKFGIFRTSNVLVGKELLLDGVRRMVETLMA